MNPPRTFAQLAALAILGLVALQLVPYGRNHSRPADGRQVAFDSPRTEQLARRACFDCHSNQTRWPWYAVIAPVSWRIQNHVDEGREALNFNALNTATEHGAEAAEEAGETVQEREMPPADYLLLHPEARLSATETNELARGLDATFSGFGERDGEHAEHADHAEPAAVDTCCGLTPPRGSAATGRTFASQNAHSHDHSDAH